MGFGWIQNVANNVRSGFNPSRMFSSFNHGDGVASVFANVLKQEFRYTEVFSFLVRASNTLSTFDWNATDEELRAKYKEINDDMASTWGGVFGRGIGSATAIALGGGSALVLPKISGARLAREVMKTASLDAKEQLIDETIEAVRETRNKAGTMLALEGFIRYRQLLKSIPLPLLTPLVGGNVETAQFIINGWGEEDGASFKISEKLDEKIEGIKNSVIQNFVQEAIEGFSDSFIDTGFVIAQEFDESLRQFQLSQSRTTEPEVIEIYPVAENPDERYVIEADTQEEIEQQAQQVINTHRVMSSRDVGQIVASSIEGYRSSPMIRKLEIVFRSIPRPPFYFPNGERAIEKVVSIPNVKMGLSWQRIKSKFGNGNVAFNAGDRWAVLKFKNTRRYIKVQLDDGQINSAEALLKDWASLSELEYDPPVRTNDYQGQTAQQRRPSTPMYVVKGRLIHTNVNANGRIQRGFPNIYLFDLWQDDPPSNFSDFFNNPRP
ncbi:hypothetical protein [Cyanobacterium aponinum]|uniref:hypothetical protein n=1 Tax=Cyanobacterium aponinum TaxID=379064 RepID=UPI000C12B169|nr:hypothetical protein [Cyanobacterium aponinum]PHV63191.1 hypothetical protein CSQ80_06560 [Cyanobacterium aponinum IPPAS B-1201]